MTRRKILLPSLTLHLDGKNGARNWFCHHCSNKETFYQIMFENRHLKLWSCLLNISIGKQNKKNKSQLWRDGKFYNVMIKMNGGQKWALSLHFIIFWPKRSKISTTSTSNANCNVSGLMKSGMECSPFAFLYVTFDWVSEACWLVCFSDVRPQHHQHYKFNIIHILYTKVEHRTPMITNTRVSSII